MGVVVGVGEGVFVGTGVEVGVGIRVTVMLGVGSAIGGDVLSTSDSTAARLIRMTGRTE